MKWIIFISILLYGCGEPNHGYGWEYDYKYQGMRVRGGDLTPGEIYSEYEKAVQCFGDKSPPFIIFTNEIHSDDKILGRCGQAVTNPPLILIRFDCGKPLYAISHEMVHYFGIKKHKEDFKKGLRCLIMPGNI